MSEERLLSYTNKYGATFLSADMELLLRKVELQAKNEASQMDMVQVRAFYSALRANIHCFESYYVLGRAMSLVKLENADDGDER